VWKGEPQRISYIAREDSYHGITIGSLSVSGHRARRANFEDILLPNIHRIPACNAYRQQLPGESDAAFVARKAAELEAVFQAAGPGSIAAFIAEPVVGAALGCMTATPGYFRAMKAICEQHGALLILDEVMCGMGRTGTLHAWEQEDVVPDIQCVGKGLAGGYQACSAVLAGERVVSAMGDAGTTFTHGHTFGNHAVVSAAALAVQGIIERDGLVANAHDRGSYLGVALRLRLGNHPYVGNVRGRGLFWGVEFVRDRETKEPFNTTLMVAKLVHEKAIEGRNGGSMMIYYGQGCAGNKRGDHVMIMPAYNVDTLLIDIMVKRLADAVDAAFEEIAERE
jgi:adenosylmethionine-8-amino-7-oxononanoate aminotransferase